MIFELGLNIIIVHLLSNMVTCTLFAMLKYKIPRSVNPSIYYQIK